MARYFRFYGKKRGERHTGSRPVGRALLGLSFAAFFLGGCVTLALVLTNLTIPEWRANHEYVETTARVLGHRAEPVEGGFRPQVQIEYRAHNVIRRTWNYDVMGASLNDSVEAIRAAARFPLGQTVPCWYDPLRPQIAVLERGYTWQAWLMLLLPLPMLAVGGVGLAYVVWNWGKSSELQAITTQRLREGRIFDERPPRNAAAYPTIPEDADLTDSPGTRLAYRLPTTALGWNQLVTLVFALFWNGVVSVFLAMAIGSHLRGEPDWFMTLFVIPFLAAGVALVIVLIRQLLMAGGIGPTWVEISHHPLTPGQTYDIVVSQAGRLNLRTLRVKLVCEEQATFRQGTNTRGKTRCVVDQEILLRENLAIDQDRPYEATAQVSIPCTAMHSFRTDHNEIRWMLRVAAEPEGWPSFERAFPVVVLPGGRPRA